MKLLYGSMSPDLCRRTFVKKNYVQLGKQYKLKKDVTFIVLCFEECSMTLVVLWKMNTKLKCSSHKTLCAALCSGFCRRVGKRKIRKRKSLTRRKDSSVLSWVKLDIKL